MRIPTSFPWKGRTTRTLGQLAQGDAPREEADKPDYDLLSVEGIYSFAMGADIADVKDVLDRQIAFNTAISQEGLRGDYGANIGSVLLESYGDEVRNRAKPGLLPAPTPA